MSSSSDERAWIADDLLYSYARANGQLGFRARPVTVTSPAAGADWTTTVTSLDETPYVSWVPISVVAKLVTSAVVANRQASLVFTFGGVVIGRVPLGANQAASATNTYTCYRGGNVLNVGSPTGQSSALPFTILPAGTTIATSTVNIDVGDQWSAITLYSIEISQRTPEQLQAYADAITAGTPWWDTIPGLPLGL